MGCGQLSQKPRSGKCLACMERYLPCANATAGCHKYVFHPMHSRERRTCTSHNNQPCPFGSSQQAVRCTTLFCSNPKRSHDSSVCTQCFQGSLPCLNKCFRRTASSQSVLCQLCNETENPPSAATDSCKSVPSTVATLCMTNRCDNLVLAHGTCALCASYCFPCRQQDCPNRTVPGSAVVY